MLSSPGSMDATFPALHSQVKGLRPGRSYSFRVECTFTIPSGANFEVESLASSETVIFSTPATVPSEPRQLSLANKAPNSLTVRPAIIVTQTKGGKESFFAGSDNLPLFFILDQAILFWQLLTREVRILSCFAQMSKGQANAHTFRSNGKHQASVEGRKCNAIL